MHAGCVINLSSILNAKGVTFLIFFLFIHRVEQKKEDKPKVSYSIFSYLESSVHDKDSFAKEQSKFSGSKSLPSNIPKIDHNTNNRSTDQKKMESQTDQNKETDQHINQNKKTDLIDTGFSKRMTVAELFLQESEKSKAQGVEVTETINKFDKMDLYKSIFLSDSEDEVVEETKPSGDVTDFIETPRNIERNTSPPRGIFANIDFDEINSWKRKGEVTENKTEAKKDEKVTEKDIGEEMYGPKIPENLQKRLSEASNSKITEAIEVGSSSSEDSWVDINELKNKKQKKKKSKKHKSKHKKKSKSKKKDR